jgi:hypothetical protein
MIADFVAGCRNFVRDLRQTLYGGAALKKCCGDAVAGEQLEQGGRALTGPIVECQRDGGVVARSVPNRWREHSRRATPHCPSCGCDD